MCAWCSDFASSCLQVVENWYPGTAKDSKGVVLVVTAGKEGAISGGDKFLSVSVHSECSDAYCTAQHLPQQCVHVQQLPAVAHARLYVLK
jgi:hypothetical protein